MSWMIFAVYMALIVADFKYECDAQRVSVTSHSPSSDIDPVVNVLCMEHDLPSGYTDLTFQWEHNGIVLSRNDVLVDADSSRFSVGDNGRDLHIRNAVRDDGGRYTCRVLYRLNSESQEIRNVSNSGIVAITKYLPPLNYPVCSISPAISVTVGSEITFICDPGDSDPPVILHIRTPDLTFMGSGRVRWTVREEDIMAQFSCFMTSNTFSTPARTCFKTILIATTPTPTQGTIQTEQSFGAIYTTSDTGYAGNSEQSCIAITVLIAPVIISIVSIAAVMFLLLKNYQMKKLLFSYDKEKVNTANQELGETYMELQKTKTASDEEYTDLNLQRKPKDAGQKTVYENSGFEQSSIEETDYANVV